MGGSLEGGSFRNEGARLLLGFEGGSLQTPGSSQQILAGLIGVTYQQAQKYETGVNRISAARLYVIAQVLGVDVEYFLEGLQRYAPNEAPLQQRAFLDLARNFRSIRAPKHQEVVCLLTRILANLQENVTDADAWGPELAECA